MASSNINVTQGVWTQLTTTDKSGKVLHRKGSSQVFYIESPTQPVGFDGETPYSDFSNIGDSITYLSIPSADFLWCYSKDKDVKLSVTPAG